MSPCNSTHTFRSLRSHPNSAQLLAAAEHCRISNSSPTATQMARRDLQTAPLRAVQPWPRLAPAASPANHMWPSVPLPFPFYPTASYVRACAAAFSPILLLCSSCRNAWRRRNLRKRKYICKYFLCAPVSQVSISISILVHGPCACALLHRGHPGCARQGVKAGEVGQKAEHARQALLMHAAPRLSHHPPLRTCDRTLSPPRLPISTSREHC